MLYIGFSTRSHKILARIFCKKYRHCAPVMIMHDKCILYQFVQRKKIVPIYLKHKDINILRQFGWIFIPTNKTDISFNPLQSNAITCVQFAKRALNIQNIKIQTPDALLKHLMKQCEQTDGDDFI